MSRPPKHHSLLLTCGSSTLTVPLEEDRTDTKGYAYGALSIFGTAFHVEAVAVAIADDLCDLEALNPAYQSMVDEFLCVDADRGSPQFVTFDKREWLVLLHAHLR